MIGRPFRPGQSGNPGGRPKREGLIRELAQAATREAFERLLDIVRNGQDERSVVLACNAILDRGLGPASADGGAGRSAPMGRRGHRHGDQRQLGADRRLGRAQAARRQRGLSVKSRLTITSANPILPKGWSIHLHHRSRRRLTGKVMKRRLEPAMGKKHAKAKSGRKPTGIMRPIPISVVLDAILDGCDKIPRSAVPVAEWEHDHHAMTLLSKCYVSGYERSAWVLWWQNESPRP